MFEIVFTRVDFRLIHGQVITKWIRLCDANKIVIIDDALEKDQFLLSIYEMAAPPGFKVNVYSVKSAIENWNNGTFIDGKIFLLFKDITTLQRTVEAGFPINKVQIGGVEFKPKRVNVYGTISLDDKDAKSLKDVQDKGVEVYFQSVPDDPKTSLDTILKKHNFNI